MHLQSDFFVVLALGPHKVAHNLQHANAFELTQPGRQLIKRQQANLAVGCGREELGSRVSHDVLCVATGAAHVSGRQQAATVARHVEQKPGRGSRIKPGNVSQPAYSASSLASSSVVRSTLCSTISSCTSAVDSTQSTWTRTTARNQGKESGTQAARTSRVLCSSLKNSSRDASSFLS